MIRGHHLTLTLTLNLHQSFSQSRTACFQLSQMPSPDCRSSSGCWASTAPRRTSARRASWRRSQPWPSGAASPTPSAATCSRRSRSWSRRHVVPLAPSSHACMADLTARTPALPELGQQRQLYTIGRTHRNGCLPCGGSKTPNNNMFLETYPERDRCAMLNQDGVTLPCACPQSGAQLSPAAEAVVGDAACSRSIDLQQRALEIQALLRCVHTMFLTSHCSSSGRSPNSTSAMHAAVISCAGPFQPAANLIPSRLTPSRAARTLLQSALERILHSSKLRRHTV